MRKLSVEGSEGEETRREKWEKVAAEQIYPQSSKPSHPARLEHTQQRALPLTTASPRLEHDTVPGLPEIPHSMQLQE